MARGSSAVRKEYLEALEAKARKKAREDYKTYWQYTNPDLVLGKHIEFIINEVQSILDGTFEEDILILSVPPQNGKSETITKTLPSFFASKGNRVIVASYNDDLAKEFNESNRRKIEEYNVFDVEVRKNTADAILLDNGGSIIARGIKSGITGRPADLVIIDDPIKGYADAYSENNRNLVWQEFQMSIRSRLAAKAKIILIQTRWHEDDLAGRIMQVKGIKVKSINIPCIAEENDPLGRKVGEGLFPEIGKGTEWAHNFRQTYLDDPNGGARAWDALYQGHPTSEGGNILKRSSWKRYVRRPEFIKTIPLMIMSIDASFKNVDGADKCSIQVWGKKQAQVYMVDNITDRMSFTETLENIKFLLEKYPNISAKFVEDKANGSAIINVLNLSIGGFIPVQVDRGTGGKVARVMAIEPFVNSGNVYLPDDADWITDFVNECSEFPNSKNDDQVDAMSQALNKLIFFYANVENKHTDAFSEFMGYKQKKNDDNWADDTFIEYGF